VISIPGTFHRDDPAKVQLPQQPLYSERLYSRVSIQLTDPAARGRDRELTWVHYIDVSTGIMVADVAAYERLMSETKEADRERDGL